MSYQYISKQDDLQLLIQQLSDVQTVFVDTEFIKRNTYYPILGLIQLNLNHQQPDQNNCFLVDAVSLDLTEFWSALFKVDLMVMHACSEDVDLMAIEAKKAGITTTLPQIFDTQIGLSFLNYGLQVSYQLALEKLLNVYIDKGESCSDWVARPLRQEQLNYAVNDVEYLPRLYDAITQELTEKSQNLPLLKCAFEDSSSLSTDVLTKYPDEFIYKEWLDFKYKPKQIAQLQKLCSWREKTARENNVPRTFIIKKASLRDIIQKQPKNKKELSGINDFRHANLKKYGDNILHCLTDIDPNTEHPKRALRPFKEPADMKLANSIKTIITHVSEQTSIPEDVLMRKRWRVKLYEYVALHGGETFSTDLDRVIQLSNSSDALLKDYLTGWRFKLLTQPILLKLNEHYDVLHSQIVPFEQQIPTNQ